ncbi:Uncharacterized protein HZ326_30251, partial [Fusarium oxysporum f. sp. albedinis]
MAVASFPVLSVCETTDGPGWLLDWHAGEGAGKKKGASFSPCVANAM